MVLGHCGVQNIKAPLCQEDSAGITKHGWSGRIFLGGVLKTGPAKTGPGEFLGGAYLGNITACASVRSQCEIATACVNL